jgi:hypothetical protein
MKHTVIALFDNATEAQKAADALAGRGFDRSSVHVTAETTEPPDVEPLPAAAAIEGGPASGLLHRLAVLFGVDEPHVGHYQEAVRRGGSVVKVDAADEAQATAARDALLAQGAVNIDDRVEEWRETGWNDPGASTAVPRRAAVHRQEVSLGGVRVYGHTTATVFDDYADEFRADFATRFATSDSSYADFDPAYRYGHGLATEARFEGRNWDDIEADARADWEQRYPQSPWERFKSAVQHAWQRVSR